MIKYGNLHATEPELKRTGYSNFFGLCFMFFKINRKNKKLGVESELKIKLPIRWI